MRIFSTGTLRLLQMFFQPIACYIAGRKFLKLSPFANCVIPRKVPSDTLFVAAKLHYVKVDRPGDTIPFSSASTKQSVN
jgi:hypothetical protein